MCIRDRFDCHVHVKLIKANKCLFILRSLRQEGYSQAELDDLFSSIVLPTIPDKTTWERFPHRVHFPTQQTYFQNDAFAERKPLPPIQCCFPQMPRDQAFFWIHNNIAFRVRGRGKNLYSYDVLKKCSPSIQFSQQFCPRLYIRWFAFFSKNINMDKTETYQ